jgi:hypothetical protein
MEGTEEETTMSRYRIPAHEERYQVFVGWDDPLETLWAQVFDTTTDDDDAGCVLWEGLGFQAFQTVEALHALLQPYATIPPAIITQLRHDRAHAVPRTPLQEQMLRLCILSQRR